MRTRKSVIENVFSTSAVAKRKNLTKEDLSELFSDYQESAFQVLLDNGYVNISEDLSISLVKLKDRQYVLRGNSYSNHRKYKLKIVSSRAIYERIEKAYNFLLGV